MKQVTLIQPTLLKALPASPALESTRWQWLLRLRMAVIWLLGALLVVSLALHITVADRFDAMAPLFYATPRLILAMGTVALAVLFSGVRRWIILMFAIGLTSWWAHDSYRPGPASPAIHTTPPPEASPHVPIRFVFRNLFRPQPTLSCVSEVLAATAQPDVAGFVECTDAMGSTQDLNSLQQQGYTWQALGYGMGVASRFPIHSSRLVRLGGGSAVNIVTLCPPGRRIDLFIVDISADPFKSRRPPLTKLLELIQQSPHPHIVMGDFNTPAESVHFGPYRQALLEPFALKGNGWRETWPYGLPLLSLDHVWASRDLQVLSVHQLSPTRRFDHAGWALTLSF